MKSMKNVDYIIVKRKMTPLTINVNGNFYTFSGLFLSNLQNPNSKVSIISFHSPKQVC